MKLLDNFTVNELRVYFESKYGTEHIMSIKLNKYCLHNGFDDKWSVAKIDHDLRCHRVEKIVIDPLRRTKDITYSYYEQ